jgi:hypothetical protein
MDVFTFVIIIVIVGCGTGVLMEYFKNRREAATSEVTDEKYQLTKELDQLERSA